jgi:ABC-type methionine transport system ATPase subunit
MIELKGIELNYQKPILKGIHLQVKRGEILGLVGKSGAGKSSLLKICAGLQDPDAGQIIIDGKPQTAVRNLLVPGYAGLAIVNQDFKLDPYHTVEENLREAILHWPYSKRDKRVQKLLRLFGLKDISTTKAHLISGGEQQRVAIARAIADQPAYLVLTSWTSATKKTPELSWSLMKVRMFLVSVIIFVFCKMANSPRNTNLRRFTTTTKHRNVHGCLGL